LVKAAVASIAACGAAGCDPDSEYFGFFSDET
jgi:hypothetical protein